MNTFHAINIQGRFYERGGSLRVDTQEHLLVADVLRPMVGAPIKLYLAYEPQKGVSGPGGGSCLWGGAHLCPVHSKSPDKIVQFFGTGTLEERDVGDWFVGGARVPFHLMNGHHGRLTGVTEIVDQLENLGAGGLGMAIQEQVQMVQEILQHLKGCS